MEVSLPVYQEIERTGLSNNKDRLRKIIHSRSGPTNTPKVLLSGINTA